MQFTRVLVLFAAMITSMSLLPMDAHLGGYLWSICIGAYILAHVGVVRNRWILLLGVVAAPVAAHALSLPGCISLPLATAVLVSYVDGDREFSACAGLCSLALTVLALMNANIGFVANLASSASHQLSRFPAVLGLPYLRLGQSVSGLLLTTAILVTILLLPIRNRAALLSLLALGQLAYVLLAPFSVKHWIPGMSIVLFHLLYSLWCSTLLSRVSIRTVALDAGHTTGIRAIALRLGMAAIVLTCLGTAVQSNAALPPSRIVFLKDPSGTDYERVPQHGSYGYGNTGMFGVLVEYWEDRNVETSILQRAELTDLSLHDASALIIISPTEYFTTQQKDLVARYMEQGGHVVLLGDHTNIFGLQGPFNDLACRYGIGLGYDSAVPIRSDWVGCLARTSVVLSGLDYASAELPQLRWGIGASLHSPSCSSVLMSAKYGFSDIGDPSNDGKGGFLGNYLWDYERGEAFGDVVLACRVPRGLGSITALADTDLFQNLHVMLNDWAGRLVITAINGDRHTVLLVMGLVGFSMIVLTFRERRVLLLGAAVLLLLALWHMTANPQGITLDQPPNAALIDVTHSQDLSLNPWDDDCLYGLAAMLRREGYWPRFVYRDLRPFLADAKFLAVIGDHGTTSSRETGTIKQWVEQGGILLVASSWNEQLPLFREFGLTLENTPLGPWPNKADLIEANVKVPDFKNAWPINLGSEGLAFSVALAVRDGSSVYPLVISGSFGYGKAFFVGDEYIFRSKNLEGEQAWNEQNIGFLMSLLGQLR